MSGKSPPPTTLTRDPGFAHHPSITGRDRQPVPHKSAAETFVIHGNVIDSTGAPLPGYKMVLSDGTGTPRQAGQSHSPVNSDAYATLTLRSG